MDTYVFWHIATIGFHWQEIVADQLASLQASGLASSSKGIYAGILGDEKVDLPSNIQVLGTDRHLTHYEMFTLTKLQKFCRSIPESNVFYFHTKGVSRYSLEAQAWRKYMEFFLLHNWQKSSAYLKQYDVVGVDWQLENPDQYRKIWRGREPKPGFSGNFWWARSGHIKTLPNLEEKRGQRRTLAEEHFIGLNNPRVKCLYHAHRDLYHSIIKPQEYESHQWDQPLCSSSRS